MKIQYASDLHLEFELNRRYLQRHPLIKAGDILVLAGDTRKLQANIQDDILDRLSGQFKFVYLIPGNHEFYGKDTPINSVFPSFKKQMGSNVFYLNNEVVYHENVRMLFTTLFTRISPSSSYLISNFLNDFHLSRYHSDSMLSLSIEEYNACHELCKAFLDRELSTPFSGSTVVVTHHAPFLKDLIKGYPSFQYDLSEAFHVDLTWMMEKSKIDHWISGHTHINFPSFQIGDTWFHSNMLGYVENGEHVSFNYSKVIEV